MANLKYSAIGFLSVVVIMAALVANFMPTPHRQLATKDNKVVKKNPENLKAPFEKSKYNFTNTNLAYKVLTELDVHTPVPNSIFTGKYIQRKSYNLPVFGLKNEDDYCHRHRKAFVENPAMVFNQQNFILGMTHKSHLRNTIVPMLGVDMAPALGEDMTKAEKESRNFSLPTDGTAYFTYVPFWNYKEVNQHYSCLSQFSNFIPGSYLLNRKDSSAEAAIEYGKKFEKRPQCFSFDKFFPETWILTDKPSCEAFFKIFNSEDYFKRKQEKGIQYIRKIASGSHRGEGVFPVNDKEEEYIRTKYLNGSKCGEEKENNIVQVYVNNPLLLHEAGHKFDFRMFMLIASVDPLIVYYYDGSVRVSLLPASTDDIRAQLTNIALFKNVYKEAEAGKLWNNSMTAEDIKYFQQSHFDRLQEDLTKMGVINDPNWLDNYLRPEMKKAMVHLVRMSAHKFHKHPSVYGLYGLDFILDTDLNLWFIEANHGPSLNGGGYSKQNEEYFINMTRDHYEIMFGLLRSRMKRVVQYVNQIVANGDVKQNADGTIAIRNLEEKRAHFNKISKNYFEDEFRPKASNGFALIVDENLEGVDKYCGFIEPECM